MPNMPYFVGYSTWNVLDNCSHRRTSGIHSNCLMYMYDRCEKRAYCVAFPTVGFCALDKRLRVCHKHRPVWFSILLHSLNNFFFRCTALRTEIINGSCSSQHCIPDLVGPQSQGTFTGGHPFLFWEVCSANVWSLRFVIINIISTSMHKLAWPSSRRACIYWMIAWSDHDLIFDIINTRHLMSFISHFYCWCSFIMEKQSKFV